MKTSDMAAYHRDWYHKNKDRRKELVRANLLKKRKEYNDFKSTLECESCGDRRPYVLDFHHMDPSEKEGDSNQMRSWGLERTVREIEKCMTLCSNCHREHHYLEKNAPLA